MNANQVFYVFDPNAQQHGQVMGGPPGGQAQLANPLVHQQPDGPPGVENYEQPGGAGGANGENGVGEENLPGGAEGQGVQPAGVGGLGGQAQGQVQQQFFGQPGQMFQGMQPPIDLFHKMKLFETKMREDEVAKEVEKQSTPSGKRTVGFLVRSIYKLEDIMAETAKLEEEAFLSNSPVATANNLPRVNQAMQNQKKLISELLLSTKTEYTMETVASQSKLKWDVVKYMEKPAVFNEKLAVLSHEELRKSEREKMQLDRKKFPV